AQCIELVIVGADVDRGRRPRHVGGGGRPVDLVRSVEVPRQLAVVLVDGVDDAVVTGLVNVPEGNRGRGVEAAAAAGREARRVGRPADLPRGSVHGVDGALVVADVDDAVAVTRAGLDVS